MFSPADSNCAILPSGTVTIEKNPLEEEIEFEIQCVKESISFTEPLPNTM